MGSIKRVDSHQDLAARLKAQGIVPKLLQNAQGDLLQEPGLNTQIPHDTDEMGEGRVINGDVRRAVKQYQEGGSPFYEINCPVSCDTFVRAVQKSDGYSYDETSIKNFRGRSPMTGEPMDEAPGILNPSVAQLSWYGRLVRREVPLTDDPQHGQLTEQIEADLRAGSHALASPRLPPETAPTQTAVRLGAYKLWGGASTFLGASAGLATSVALVLRHAAPSIACNLVRDCPAVPLLDDPQVQHTFFNAVTGRNLTWGAWSHYLGDVAVDACRQAIYDCHDQAIDARAAFDEAQGTRRVVAVIAGICPLALGVAMGCAAWQLGRQRAAVAQHATDAQYQTRRAQAVAEFETKKVALLAEHKELAKEAMQNFAVAAQALAADKAALAACKQPQDHAETPSGTHAPTGDHVHVNIDVAAAPNGARTVRAADGAGGEVELVSFVRRSAEKGDAGPL